MAAYAHAPGGTPRDVLVQRQRRLYASRSLLDCLSRLGVDHSSGGAAAALRGRIALPVFDDTRFETRTHAEWVPANAALPRAPVTVLIADEAVAGGKGGAAGPPASGSWQRGVAVDVHPLANEYLVQLDAGQRLSARGSVCAHRVFVCFDAEDPEVRAASTGARHSS